MAPSPAQDTPKPAAPMSKLAVFTRLALVFVVAAVAMNYAFNMGQWRVENASLPRYCDDPDGAIERVRRILSEPDPIKDNQRRAYIVAAKLMYLVPQGAGENLDDYLPRLRQRIEESCR